MALTPGLSGQQRVHVDWPGMPWAEFTCLSFVLEIVQARVDTAGA
jgi:hypothetical protein